LDLFSLAVYFVLIMSVAAGGLGASALLGARKKGLMKEEPIECGVPQIGETRAEFNVRFFVISMLFVLFDIEVVLLAPYAVTFVDDVRSGKGFEYLGEVAVFLAVLGMGLLYAWRKGVLDWNVPLGMSPETAARQMSLAAEPKVEHPHGHEKHAA
jgi:NADH-quinone oxidoreductase subunit A